jgi:hypothetical protein
VDIPSGKLLPAVWTRYIDYQLPACHSCMLWSLFHVSTMVVSSVAIDCRRSENWLNDTCCAEYGCLCHFVLLQCMINARIRTANEITVYHPGQR